jgi:hypothetical protein
MFGPLVDSTDLICPLLTSAGSLPLLTKRLAFANQQISPGNAHNFLAYACYIYATASVQVLGSDFMAPLPSLNASCSFCSSGQHFASGFLQILPRDRHPCLWLMVPLVGPIENFHLLVVRPAGRTSSRRGLSPPSSHTTVRTDPYTAVHKRFFFFNAFFFRLGSDINPSLPK